MRTIRKMFWVWGLYFLPIPGILRPLRRDMPSSDTIKQAQWMLVQAFGRDSFGDRELAEQLSRICGTKANIFRFASLRNAGFKPGRANEELAKYCSWLWYSNLNIVMELQWEVAYALWLRNSQLYLQQQSLVNVIWPAGEYFATFHVVEKASEDIRRRGLDPHKGINLSHPDMIVRAVPIAWKYGLDPRPWVARIPFGGPGSVQPWTRGRAGWFIRETLTRLHHLANMILRRKIMAIRPPAAP